MSHASASTTMAQQLSVLSLDLPFPDNTVVFEASELIDAMEKENSELTQTNNALRSAITQIDGTLNVLRETGVMP